MAAPAREGVVSCGGSTGGGCTMGPSLLVTSHSMNAGIMRTCSTGAELAELPQLTAMRPGISQQLVADAGHGQGNVR